MLPQSIRLDLRQRRDFFGSAQVIRTPHLTVFWNPIESPPLRAAIVVKKKSGGAVQRAKFRRLLRSALIELWAEKKSLFSLSVGVVFLPRGPLQSLIEYKNEISESLSQIKES